MQASAQAFDDETGFDRAAAEAFLRELRGAPAPRRRPARAVRPDLASLPQTPPIDASSATRPGRKAWPAAVMAILAPIAIGAGLAFWSAVKPLGPDSGPSLDTAQAASLAAYEVTAPVAVNPAAKRARPARSTRQHARRPHRRPHAAAAHRPRIERPADDIPADFPF
jgi:hypothetical protein